MARRPRSDDPVALGVRAALIEKLSGHVRLTVDPRMVMEPKEEWPDPMPPYVDYIADRYDDLVAGKAVDVPSWQMRGIAEVPPGCYSVRVAIDGTISETPRDG